MQPSKFWVNIFFESEYYLTSIFEGWGIPSQTATRHPFSAPIGRGLETPKLKSESNDLMCEWHTRCPEHFITCNINIYRYVCVCVYFFVIFWKS